MDYRALAEPVTFGLIGLSLDGIEAGLDRLSAVEDLDRQLEGPERG